MKLKLSIFMALVVFSILAFGMYTQWMSQSNPVHPGEDQKLIHTDILMHVIGVSKKEGCKIQNQDQFKNIKFFVNPFKLSKEFSIKDSTGKVLGHFRTDFYLEIMDELRDHFKLSAATYHLNPDKSNKGHYMNLVSMFFSSRKYFGIVFRIPSPFPEYDFIQIGIYDNQFSNSLKDLKYNDDDKK